MPTTYPTELKIRTIHRYKNGESIKSLSEELHISQSTLYHWRNEYCSIETSNRTYTPKEFDVISRRLQKLEHLLEIIQQSGYLSNVPLQKNLLLLSSSIINLTIDTAFMSCAKHWMLQGEHAITTSSAGQTVASMKMSRPYLC